MFNQLTPTEIVVAIGATARQAARSEGPSSDFERDQLMSAYSATRHLAVELSSYGPELIRFAQTVAGAVDGARLSAGDPERDRIASELAAMTDAAAIGAAICELLDGLRQDDSPEAERLRSEIHASLRELADREVELLADALA